MIYCDHRRWSFVAHDHQDPPLHDRFLHWSKWFPLFIRVNCSFMCYICCWKICKSLLWELLNSANHSFIYSAAVRIWHVIYRWRICAQSESKTRLFAPTGCWRRASSRGKLMSSVDLRHHYFLIFYVMVLPRMIHAVCNRRIRWSPMTVYLILKSSVVLHNRNCISVAEPVEHSYYVIAREGSQTGASVDCRCRVGNERGGGARRKTTLCPVL